MLRDNKGSILVATIVFFSIIMTVCLSCISIIYSNNNYAKLQYQHIKMKELALSGIEITRSNILSQVKYAVENFDEEEEFRSYFLGNTREIIGDISKTGLDNVRVGLKGKSSSDSEGNVIFKVESICKKENYTNRVIVSVKILNPWNKYFDNEDDVANESQIIDGFIYNEDYNSNKENLNNNIDTTKDHNNKFNEKELVVIYDYEEI